MAIAESVVELLLQKLVDQLIQEAIFLRGVRDQVEWLEAEFRWMQCFLKDADSNKEGDGRVKNWVQDVKDVAYDAEDLIDTFVFKIANLKRRGFVGRIRRYAFIFNELITLHKVGSEIERIKNKIRTISESRSTYGIENISQGVGSSSQDWRLTSPLAQEPDFVGFEKDLETLVARLMEGKPRRCVVSVVGMGGLGKTTLTKKIYNNTRVEKHFHSSAWISISQEYAVRDLLQNIINCYMVLSEEELKKMNIFQLRHKISQYLQDKRYLIVLDDIWTNEAWDDLKDAFPDMNNGSRVMFTTRYEDVALNADAQSPPYELRFLETDESWELFCKKTFPGQGIGCPQDLEKSGREIVEKCHGLPLAIIVIGGLLSRKEPREWDNVRKSISWQFVEGQPQISRILSLSYRDLPYHLKPCFLYLGVFPEDYKFRAKKLIQLWVAEGLLQRRGDETLEEVGEDCLKELIQRSMIQLANRSSSGGIKSCLIHDLLQDLSISEAKEEKFLQIQHENVDALSTSMARRLAIHHNALSEYTSLKSSTPCLRSVLIYTQVVDRLERKQEMFLYRGFKLLRVLDLNKVAIQKLPNEIGALIHLRYLGCTRSRLERLPSSIGNLQNLQTLIVTTYNGILKIPSKMEKMQQLRHFQLKSPYEVGAYQEVTGVIEGHPRLDRISNLQTLSCVKAGEWMHGCLGKLTNLRKLGICLDNEGAYAEVFYEFIVKFDCLQSLRVEGKKFPLNFPFPRLPMLSKLRLKGKLEKLPEFTEFPKNLTKLTLLFSELKQDPLATLETLKNLRILKLRDSSFLGVEMACTAQGFPRLEALHFRGLHELEEWRVEEGAMPSLLHLHINGCLNLEKLPEGLQHVTTLKILELWNMPDEFKERLREDG
ncbi:disease resistance RPP8-like protein 3 [Magnolia sinica]|uniref:disease resistance RPP8-like protein 3 n=1 Tax=Magnolia sinica TaxID=86752 RepID=UPI0026587D1C|nr:disease resistance RPP8-like protein 3 [Magnolia sinica]XP_058115160.1 disease resistance RPP8-like protein 3 [Magnolia sinica]XP_058115161.1 disease resistance RPP8-like protein 3 [Magnolia sinica]XP_058115162.1 disease resistance RPP8-like protein 3 [Magnolia sinica]XP_058115164.1 disease resistance RPP8-like protein 3 [Magnolia sinica]XP_058115165.1 disease resistance RPP8-like protein 3 [Magnolia sinica]